MVQLVAIDTIKVTNMRCWGGSALRTEGLLSTRECYGDRGLWIRPRAMFREIVSIDGHSVHGSVPCGLCAH